MIDPQPLSITAKGGNMIQRITRQIDIAIFFIDNSKTLKTLLSYE